MEFSTKWLADFLPHHSGAASQNITLKHVRKNASDSMHKGLFVPIEENDPGNSLKQAISNGAVASFWNKGDSIPAFVPTDFPLFLVEDTSGALVQIAKAYLQEIAPTMVCITGITGATETKQTVSTILEQHGSTYVIEDMIDSEIQLSLEILNMPRETTTCVVEFDLNHSESLVPLSVLANPSISVITSVSSAENELVQKSVEMFAGLNKNGKVVIDGDEPALSTIHDRGDLITCGFHAGNVAVVTAREGSNEVSLNGKQYVIDHTEPSSMLYVGYAIIVGHELGLDSTSLQQGLLDLPSSF